MFDDVHDTHTLYYSILIFVDCLKDIDIARSSGGAIRQIYSEICACVSVYAWTLCCMYILCTSYTKRENFVRSIGRAELMRPILITNITECLKYASPLWLYFVPLANNVLMTLYGVVTAQNEFDSSRGAAHPCLVLASNTYLKNCTYLVRNLIHAPFKIRIYISVLGPEKMLKHPI